MITVGAASSREINTCHSAKAGIQNAFLYGSPLHLHRGRLCSDTRSACPPDAGMTVKLYDPLNNCKPIFKAISVAISPRVLAASWLTFVKRLFIFGIGPALLWVA